MDYSFLKLYNSISEALTDNEFKDSGISYYTVIQLFTDEPYLQMTNYEGGISISSDFTAYLVDNCDNNLLDITSNIFIEEFTDANGDTQCKIELVNIPSTFYGRAILIKIVQDTSDVSYYTRPLKITNGSPEKTYRLDYTNNSNLEGLSYVEAGCYQSIRLSMKFNGYSNTSEVGEYYQISTKNNISTRFLSKIAKSFLVENIDSFTFTRLQEVLSHDIIYIDGKRVTNKPVLEQGERIGQSNLFKATFTAYFNGSDTYDYDYQIFEGFSIVNYVPFGSYSTGTTFLEVSFDTDVDITLNTGSITIFNSLGTLQTTFNETSMSVSGNTLTIPTSLTYSDDDYYVNITGGLVSGLGIDNEPIIDNSTWTFTLRAADYSVVDYSATDYNTGISDPIDDNLIMFYKFNEISGTTAVDSKGSNDGTIVNALINQVGLIDKCYEFNNGSTDEYVSIPSTSELNLGSGAFSIEVWVNPTANFGRILNKYNASTGDLEYRMFIQGGVLQFFIYTDASNRIGIADNATITTGGWQQIVVTYDGSGNASGLKMKVDNVTASFASAETGNYIGMPPTTQAVILGQQSDDLSGANRYSGLMDILRIWKGYELTDADITTKYNSGNGTET